MQQEDKPVYTPQFSGTGNIIFQSNEQSLKGNPFNKTYQCSDEILSEFEDYSLKLKSVPISEIIVMRKDLDKPLGAIKSFFSKIINVKDEHQFLMIQTDHFLLTIDFYINNRLIVRIGSRQFVLSQKKSDARKMSKVLREEKGVQWRRVLRKDEQLTVGDVLQYLRRTQMEDYKQIFHNGSHFSQNLYAYLQQSLIKKHQFSKIRYCIIFQERIYISPIESILNIILKALRILLLSMVKSMQSHDLLTDEKNTSNYSARQLDSEDQLQEFSADENVQNSILVKQPKKADSPKSGFKMTVFTIIKNTIGAAIISLPYTISKFGYGFAIVIYIVVVFLSFLSTKLLIKAKNLSRHSNYSTIFYSILPYKLAKGLDAAFVVLRNIGVCIIQLTVFKEAIRKVLVDFMNENERLQKWYTSQAFLLLILAISEVPLCMLEKFKQGNIFSLIGFFALLSYLLSLMAHFLYEIIIGEWLISDSSYIFHTNSLKSVAVIPNIILALTFQANFFPIYKGMQAVNDEKFKIATLTSLVICASLCLFIGVYTYLLYGQDLQANFLLCLDYQTVDPILYYGMNLSFCIFIIFTFPVSFISARDNFIKVVKLVRSYCTQKNIIESEKHILSPDKKQPSQFNQQVEALKIQEYSRRKQQSRKLFYFLAILLYLIICFLSELAGDIEVIINLIGAVCSIPVCFLFPYYFYFKISKLRKRKTNSLYYYCKIAFFFFIPFLIFAVIAKNI